MSNPFRLLILLVAASPAILFVDGTMIHGIVTALAALAVGALAVGIRPGEADHLSGLVRPHVAILAIPAIFMLIQAMPIPVPGAVNPVWTSAATALGSSIMGRISVDPGATLLSLTRYLSVVGIGLVAVAVSIDRRRAELVLFWLTGFTAMAAGLLVLSNLGVFKPPGGGADIVPAPVCAAVSVLGTIIAASTAIRAFERYETRRSAHEMTFGRFALVFALSLAALAICWLALSSRSAQIFAAACGTATVVLIEAIRRLGLGQWMSAAIGIVAIIVAAAFAVNQPGAAGDLSLRFAPAGSASSVAVAERILADTNWAGSGAGSFAALTPIYRDIDEADATEPTTASAIAIELGRSMLLVCVLMMIAAAALLVRGALQRGRDSFYPVAGAGCAIALTIEAFTDATALSTAPQIIAAGILGLALAQSVSRTAQ